MVQRLTSLLVASATVVAPSSASFLRPRHSDALTLESQLSSAGNGGEFTWYRRSTGDMKNASLNFDEAILSHSNLGNKGPDSGEQSLRFAKIGSQNGTVYDMVISVADGSSYDGDTNKNLLDPLDDLGQINIYCGTHSNFVVNLYEHETNTSIVVDRFFLTVFDIDAGSMENQAGIETNEIGPVSSFYMDPNDQLNTTRKGNGYYSFTATQTGSSEDNPTDPWSLDAVQAKRAVMLEFRETSSFFMSMEATPGKAKRNMLFSGPSSMLDNGFGPCRYQQTLNLKLATMMVNNLGGSSSLVENAMAIQNALTIDGQSVDLKIEPVGDYQPGNAEQNGLRGEFAQINVPANAATTFRFTFMVNGTSYPVHDLFFAFYDIDAEANGGHEMLTMLNGGGTFFLSDTTTILPDASDVSTPTFTASVYGSIKNNPTGATANSAQLDNAVTFYFHRATESFDITFATAGVFAPRNFAFGGDTMACGR